jgi:hypothetical protein
LAVLDGWREKENSRGIEMRNVKLALLFLVLLPTYVRADVVYDETQTFPNNPNTAVVRVYVQGNLVRREKGQTVLLLTDQTMFLIDNAHRTYYSLALEKVRKRIAAQMQASGSVVRPGAPPLDYFETNKSESVEGRECRLWEGMGNGYRRLELCVAPSETITGGDQILGGLRAMDRFFAGGGDLQPTPLGSVSWWSGIDRFSGLPILIRYFTRKGESAEITFTGLREETFPDDLFRVPEGYQLKQAPPSRRVAPP